MTMVVDKGIVRVISLFTFLCHHSSFMYKKSLISFTSSFLSFSFLSSTTTRSTSFLLLPPPHRRAKTSNSPTHQPTTLHHYHQQRKQVCSRIQGQRSRASTWSRRCNRTPSRSPSRHSHNSRLNARWPRTSRRSLTANTVLPGIVSSGATLAALSPTVSFGFQTRNDKKKMLLIMASFHECYLGRVVLVAIFCAMLCITVGGNIRAALLARYGPYRLTTILTFLVRFGCCLNGIFFYGLGTFFFFVSMRIS